MHSSRMRTVRCSGRLMVGGGGCLPGGGWSVQGGVYPGGVSPPVNRITDRCKNITLPQVHQKAIREGHFKKVITEGHFQPEGRY